MPALDALEICRCVRTLMQAMSGTYAAAMEGHTSAWYVSEWLRIGGANLSPAAIVLGTSYVKHAGGVLRAMCESVA